MLTNPCMSTNPPASIIEVNSVSAEYANGQEIKVYRDTEDGRIYHHVVNRDGTPVNEWYKTQTVSRRHS